MLTCECGTCNVCKSRERMRRQRIENPDHVRAIDRARYYRDREKRMARMQLWAEQNREKVRDIKKRWREANREKISAQGKARRAMLKGLLQRGRCEVCGAENVQMHHDDYSHPLDVRWLCSRHHGEHHRQY